MKITDIPQYHTDERVDTHFVMSEIQKPTLVPSSESTEFHSQYTMYFRKMDQAVIDLMSNMQCLDKSGAPFIIPVVRGTMDKIVATIFGETTRKSQDNSGQFTKVILPIIGVTPGSGNFSIDRYIYHEAKAFQHVVSTVRPNDTIYSGSVGLPIDRKYKINMMTNYMEQMNMMMEQLYQKFCMEIEINIGGNIIPSYVKLESTSDNFSEDDTQEKKVKLYRLTCTLNVAGWLPQPLKTTKNIFQFKTDIGYGDPSSPTSFQSDTMHSFTKNPLDEK